MGLREDCIEAGIVRVVAAAKDMRKHHISLIPRPTFAVTDADGLARLGVDDVVRLALDALLDTLEGKQNPLVVPNWSWIHQAIAALRVEGEEE